MYILVRKSTPNPPPQKSMATPFTGHRQERAVRLEMVGSKRKTCRRSRFLDQPTLKFLKICGRYFCFSRFEMRSLAAARTSPSLMIEVHTLRILSVALLGSKLGRDPVDSFVYPQGCCQPLGCKLHLGVVSPAYSLGTHPGVSSGQEVVRLFRKVREINHAWLEVSRGIL